MADIELNKRYKYAGDIAKELMEHSDWSVESIIEFLNSIPDADVVEVVRCKDCMFYEPLGNGKVGICRHLKLKSYLKHNIDFCSYGQRK